jgi:hypothetical protein
VRYCVLRQSTKLVYDTDNKNPTLSVLIGALLTSAPDGSDGLGPGLVTRG